MIVTFLLVTCCAAAFAQGNAHEEALAKALAEGQLKVLEMDDRIRDPTKEYLELIADRRESVEWEHVVQRTNVNRSMTAAFFKGMLRNNQFSAFQCIAKVIAATVEKIDASASNVQNITDLILEKGLVEVSTLRLITSGLLNYIEELHERKLQELKKETDEKARDKILGNAREKMRLLETVLADVEGRAKEIKFKFFEEYVRYSHDTDNYLRKTAREGAHKALKCVS